MDVSAPGSRLQQNECVSRALLDLLLPESLMSHDGSMAGHPAMREDTIANVLKVQE